MVFFDLEELELAAVHFRYGSRYWVNNEDDICFENDNPSYMIQKFVP